MLGRLTGKALCKSCDARERQAKQGAAQEYRGLIAQLSAAPERADELRPSLQPAAERAGLRGTELATLNRGAFGAYLERILEDDYLTVDEEAGMNEVAEALGIDQTTFEKEFVSLLPRLFVARANDGRLPELPEPHIILKKGEVAHLETNAALMKEVVHREYQGGYSGVSFRIVKGVRFHTGATRGKSVVTGTSLQVADTGALTVTSERVVYTGARQSIEMPYAKLLSLNVFNDGIQVHLSNRKNPPLFRLEAGLGNAVAAAINAASQ